MSECISGQANTICDFQHVVCRLEIDTVHACIHLFFIRSMISEGHICVRFTIGGTCFPECLRHSGKSQKHSDSGEELPGKRLTGKSSSPSAKNRTLREEFPDCHGSTRVRFNAVDGFFLLFPECNTRGRNSFFFKFFPECQLPRHSGKALGFF
jgi:hypothetical protein